MPRKEVTYCQGWNFLVSFSLDFTKKRNDGRARLLRYRVDWIEVNSLKSPAIKRSVSFTLFF